jgi:hypothetical protein
VSSSSWPQGRGDVLLHGWKGLVEQGLGLWREVDEDPVAVATAWLAADVAFAFEGVEHAGHASGR